MKTRTTTSKGLKSPKESEILSSICQYLFDVKHYFGWRQNTIPVFSSGRFFSMPKYSMNGVPDIILIKNGQFIGIEVKRDKGVLSDSQCDFRDSCVRNGGEYAVARSIDDVIALGL